MPPSAVVAINAAIGEMRFFMHVSENGVTRFNT